MSKVHESRLRAAAIKADNAIDPKGLASMGTPVPMADEFNSGTSLKARIQALLKEPKPEPAK